MGNFGETTDLLMLVNNELTRLHGALVTHIVKPGGYSSETIESAAIHAEWSKGQIAFLHQALANALGSLDFTAPIEVSDG